MGAELPKRSRYAANRIAAELQKRLRYAADPDEPQRRTLSAQAEPDGRGRLQKRSRYAAEPVATFRGCPESYSHEHAYCGGVHTASCRHHHGRCHARGLLRRNWRHAVLEGA